MSQPIRTNQIHHLTLTVSEVRRSVDFYTRILGFQVVMELGSRVLLANGAFILVLTLPPDPTQAIAGDCPLHSRPGACGGAQARLSQPIFQAGDCHPKHWPVHPRP